MSWGLLSNVGIAEFFGSIRRIKEFQKLNKEKTVSEESSENCGNGDYESPKFRCESETRKLVYVALYTFSRYVLKMQWNALEFHQICRS